MFLSASLAHFQMQVCKDKKYVSYLRNSDFSHIKGKKFTKLENGKKEIKTTEMLLTAEQKAVCISH